MPKTDGLIGDKLSIQKHRDVDLTASRFLFIVGDIHGEYDRLMKFLNANDFDPNRDHVVSVGDLIDRGPDSAKCLSLIYEPWFSCVIGNHELLMYDALHTLQGSEQLWYQNGGAWFMMQSTEERDETKAYIKDLVVGGFSSITATVKFGQHTFGIVHAEPPTKQSERQPGHNWDDVRVGDFDQQVAVWSRSLVKMAQLDAFKNPVRNVDAVFCGHTPMHNYLQQANIYWIDTGACFSDGAFTAFKFSQNESTGFAICEIRE